MERFEYLVISSIPSRHTSAPQNELGQKRHIEADENNDASEVLYTLQEMLMNLGPRRWMVVSILVELAMDHKPSHREMASVLISELYLKVISQRDIGKGNL